MRASGLAIGHPFAERWTERRWPPDRVAGGACEVDPLKIVHGPSVPRRFKDRPPWRSRTQSGTRLPSSRGIELDICTRTVIVAESFGRRKPT